MSKPMGETPKRRPRRQFTDEFKASAVRLVLDEGKSVAAAARDLNQSDQVRTRDGGVVCGGGARRLPTLRSVLNLTAADRLMAFFGWC